MAQIPLPDQAPYAHRTVGCEISLGSRQGGRGTDRVPSEVVSAHARANTGGKDVWRGGRYGDEQWAIF